MAAKKYKFLQITTTQPHLFILLGKTISKDMDTKVSPAPLCDLKNYITNTLTILVTIFSG